MLVSEIPPLMFKKSTLAAILCLMSITAAGQHWEQFLQERWGTYSVDVLDVREEERNGVKLFFAQVKLVHTQPDEIGIVYTITEEVLSSNNCQSQPLSYRNYDSQGRLLRSRENSSKESTIELISSNKLVYATDKRSVNLCKQLLSLEANDKVKKAIQLASNADIPLRKSGGVYEAKVVLNDDVSTYFVIDSGAADLTVSEDVMKLMMRNGSVRKSDISSTATYRVANGQRVTGTVFNMRKVTIGNVTLSNVQAVVIPGADAPLLGQSFLRRLGSWKINSQKNILEINN